MRTWPEHEYIKTWLPSKGAKHVSVKLNRKLATVCAYAKRHGIEFGDLRGFMRVPDAAIETGLDPVVVWNRGRREGVLRVVGPGKSVTRWTVSRAKAALVPTWWVEQVTAEVRELRRGEELREAGWLTTRQVMRLWSVGFGTVQRALNGRGALARILTEHNTRTARTWGKGRSGDWLVNPFDAEKVRRHLDNGRHRAKCLVSVKSIYTELGAAPGTAALLAKKLGCELIFTHGRLMAFVTEEVAQVMRERLGEVPS